MKNYRIVELVFNTGEVRYKVQRECKTLFGKTKWESYYVPEGMCLHYDWVSSERGSEYSSLRDAKNLIADLKRDELRKEVKSIRVLSNEEVDSCC